MSMDRFYPPKSIKESYNSEKSIQTRIARIKEKYGRKIRELETGEKDKLHSIVKGHLGHFRGPGSDKMQKGIFLVLIFITAILGPLGLGYLNLGLGTQSFIFGIVFVLLLFLFDKIGMINFKQLTGIIMFWVFNAMIIPLMNSEMLASLIGGSGDAVVKGIMFLFMALFTLNYGGLISGKVIAVLAVMTLLAVATPYMIGVLSNPEKLQNQQDKAMIEAQIAMDNGNLVERIGQWFRDSMDKGAGKDIDTAVQENTAEYVGVEISDVISLKDTYYEGEDVLFMIDFEGKVFEQTTVRTECMATSGSATHFGKTFPNTFDMQQPILGANDMASLYSTVECTFENMPSGMYRVDVFSYYRHSSSLDLPLRTMSYDSSIELYKNLVRTDKYSSLKDVIGGDPDIVYSSGPVQLHPANAKDENSNPIFIDPLVIDERKVIEEGKEAINLRFMLKKSDTDLNGEVQKIHGLTFNMPEGMELSCLGMNEGAIFPHDTIDERWVSILGMEDFDINLKEVVPCKIYFDKAYVDKYIPDTLWSSESMRIIADYDYETKYPYQEALQVI